MDKLDTLRRVSEIRRQIRELTTELESLQTGLYGSSRRGHPGLAVRLTWPDKKTRCFLSVASAIRFCRSQLGLSTVRRGTATDLSGAAARLGCSVEVEGSDDSELLEERLNESD